MSVPFDCPPQDGLYSKFIRPKAQNRLAVYESIKPKAGEVKEMYELFNSTSSVLSSSSKFVLIVNATYRFFCLSTWDISSNSTLSVYREYRCNNPHTAIDHYKDLFLGYVLLQVGKIVVLLV
ncbi:hypothetical protein KHA80_21260 [Anaerobacillus sp. HL2]|nr:hypothetical protein KHA80_21260 [Anaerobacillus sp. HL2]